MTGIYHTLCNTYLFCEARNIYSWHVHLFFYLYLTDVAGTAGVEENCLFMKEIGDSIAGRQKIFDAFERATLPLQSAPTATSQELDDERRRMLHFVVVFTLCNKSL